MTKRFNLMMLSTALGLPLSAPAFSQSAETTCEDLAALVERGLPSGMRDLKADL